MGITVLKIVTYNVSGDLSRLSMVTNCVLQLCYTVLKIVTYNVSGDLSRLSMVTNCVLQLCYTVENCYLQCIWGSQSSVYGHKLCFTAVLHF